MENHNLLNSTKETKILPLFGKKDAQRPQNAHMNIKINSEIDLNFHKTHKTLSFLANNLLSKFLKKRKWNLEVWLVEKKIKGKSLISCGMALKRPKKNSIYVKKETSGLGSSVKKCLKIIENELRKERNLWKKKERPFVGLGNLSQ